MTRLLIRVFPASWRGRYGDEFAALLEERPLGPYDVADVLLAALDAHLSVRGPVAAADGGRGLSMSIRIGGAAAVLGGSLWLVGFLVSQFDGSDAFGVGGWVALAGTIGLLVALVGLSAVQSRRHPRLIWLSVAMPALGALVSGIGLLGMGLAEGGGDVAGVDPWALWTLGTVALVAGSGLFALASWRSRVLSGPGLALLALAMAALVPVLPMIAGLVAIPWEPFVAAALLALLLSFAAGWIVIGLVAIRSGSPGSPSVGVAG